MPGRCERSGGGDATPALRHSEFWAESATASRASRYLPAAEAEPCPEGCAEAKKRPPRPQLTETAGRPQLTEAATPPSPH